MTYPAAWAEPLAQRLVHELPGLDISHARAWIKAQSGFPRIGAVQNSASPETQAKASQYANLVLASSTLEAKARLERVVEVLERSMGASPAVAVVRTRRPAAASRQPRGGRSASRRASR